MSMEVLQQTCAFQQHKESKQLVPAAASMSPNHHYLQLEDKLLQQQQISELGIVHTRHSSVPDSLLLKGSAMNAAENGWSPAHASKGVGVAGDLKHAAMVKLQNNSSSHGNNKIKNVMQAAAKQQQSNGGSNRTTTDEESVDYDSSLENTSVSSFDFNRERAAAAAAAAAANAGQRTSSNGNVSASLHHKPAVPSKWDDAEKWLISADAAALRGNKPKMQQLLSTIPSHVIINASKKAALLGQQQQQQAVRSNNKQLAGGGDQSSDETTVTTKKIDTAGGPYKFSFMPSPAAVLLNNPHSKTRSMSSLDRYPLEELLTCDHQKLTLVSLSDDHDTADDDTMSKPALRTEKPTSDFPTSDISAAAANGKVSNGGVAVEGTAASRDMDEQNGSNSYVTTPPPLLHHHHHHHHHSGGGGGGGGGGGLRSVSMRDMGTEMTPIASQEPSRTGTPLRATTPTIRSPVSSRPSTPGRLPAATATTATSATATNVSSDEATTTTTGTVLDGELSEKQLQAKTRQEILALGTQLGKANIAAWASREEEEEDASKCLKNIDLDEVKRNVLEARACAWEEQEKAKYEARYKREESKIIAWENHEKAKAEAEMRRIEVKVERMRSHSHEQLMNKLAVSHRRAEDLRAAAEARRVEQAAKTAQRAEYIRQTGNMPPANSSSFSQVFQQLGRLCC